MGRSSNCLKILYFSIEMHYEGMVYSEYSSCPQVHLTSWGDVLQNAQSRQTVLWVVGIQIIHLLDKYHSIYLLEGTHMILDAPVQFPVQMSMPEMCPECDFVQPHAKSGNSYRIRVVAEQSFIPGTSWACSFAWGTALECPKII